MRTLHRQRQTLRFIEDPVDVEDFNVLYVKSACLLPGVVPVFFDDGRDAPVRDLTKDADDAAGAVLVSRLAVVFLEWDVLRGLFTLPLLQWTSTGWYFLAFKSTSRALAIVSGAITSKASLLAGMGTWTWRMPFEVLNSTLAAGYSSSTKVLFEKLARS